MASTACDVIRGRPGTERPALYGPPCGMANVFDDVLVAARAGALRRTGVRFDPDFSFHFRIADFCRSCERAGLWLGVWPIAIADLRDAAASGSATLQADAARYHHKWSMRIETL